MNSNLVEILKTSVLFQRLSKERIAELLEHIHHRVHSYHKGEILFIEGDDCDVIGIILDGEIELYKGVHSGKRISLTRLHRGDIFAEVIIFSDIKQYPVTAEALTSTRILFIPRWSLMQMYLEEPMLMETFIGILSNKIRILSEQLTLLSLKNMRQKIAYFILKEGLEKNEKGIVLNMSRQKFSEKIGVERPSLSRELIKMQDEGILNLKGQEIIAENRRILLDIIQI